MEGHTLDRRGERVLPTLCDLVRAGEPAERLAKMRAAFDERGMGDTAWMASVEAMRLAFPPSFGRTEFCWDDDASDIAWVLSIVDCVVSLASAWVIPPCLDWHECTVVLPPVDWKCGGA